MWTTAGISLVFWYIGGATATLIMLNGIGLYLAPNIALTIGLSIVAGLLINRPLGYLVNLISKAIDQYIYNDDVESSPLNAKIKPPNKMTERNSNKKSFHPAQLIIATLDNDILQAKKLILRGADVNFQHFKNFTPLHIAVTKNNLNMIKLLLKHGGNIQNRNFDGHTPLDLIKPHQVEIMRHFNLQPATMTTHLPRKKAPLLPHFNAQKQSISPLSSFKNKKSCAIRLFSEDNQPDKVLLDIGQSNPASSKISRAS